MLPLGSHIHFSVVYVWMWGTFYAYMASFPEPFLKWPGSTSWEWA